MNDATLDPKQIFLNALERNSAEELERYLAEACGGNSEVRSRVEALLRAHGAVGNFLGGPPSHNPTIDQPSTVKTGSQIGAYKLLEQIGEGGMGTVWMAQQTDPVKRLVALKLIKAGMDSRQVIARFEAERQALALMDHQNIARVLDAGTTPVGCPYFVMDLVKGVPITKYCDEHHLTPRQRLELFIPVCQAIQHAHQKGIIHRDIKPSNVLVALYDGKPVPKVIDFGVAKAAGQSLTEKTLVTGLGNIVGTLEYMSPEQAEINQLDIDTRCDIYSLGVLLYELLAGSPPFNHKEMGKAGLLEMLRVIREQEPSKPSTKLSTADGLPTLAANRGTQPAKLTKLVRGELDWIVMKALEKDRSRRYETANGFAMDVQRYLADEPVQACPPSAGYRLRKFVRRNKTSLLMAAGVMLAVLLAVGAIGWALRDREAREQEIALESARKLALTEQAIRDALDRAGKSRGDLLAVLKKQGGVQDLLNQPARWDLFLKSAQAEVVQARRLLARAEGDVDAKLTQGLDWLERQLASDEADFRLALRLEKIRQDRATWAAGAFNYRTAVEEYPKALAGLGVLTQSPEVAAARLAASRIKEQLVAALDDWANVAVSEANSKEQMRAALGLARQLTAVARKAMPNEAWGDRLRRVELWCDEKALAKVAAEAPVGSLSPQLLEVVGSFLGKDTRVAWLCRAQAQHPADFWLAFNLAWEFSRTNPADAVGWYRVALAIRPTNAAAHNNLGIQLKKQGKVDDAIVCYNKAIKLDPKFAPGYVNLGAIALGRKKLPEAIAAFRKAIELEPQFAHAYLNLGNAFREQGKVDDAIAACRQAIKLDPMLAEAHHELGLGLWSQGKVNEAIACFRKAIALDPKSAPAHNSLGAILCDDLRDYENAAACFRKAIELDPKRALAHSNLGNALLAQGKLDEAIAEYRKNIKLDPKFAVAHSSLGNALLAQGKLDEAIAEYRKTMELDPENDIACFNLGQILTHLGKLDHAVAAFRKAIALNPGRAEPHYFLGLALLKLGQFDQALKALQKGHELGCKRPDWRLPSTQWIKECERLLALEKRLPHGKAADPAEQLSLADLCLLYKKRYREAARLFGRAFAADPKLAETHRYNAACAATLAASGKGADADKLHGTDKARLRKQALEWLRADLAGQAKLLAQKPATAEPIQKALHHWLGDPDLSSVRDAKELDALPREEREAWMKLWSAVRDLVRQAEKK
jgi:tetratricopeptide (TPR) repeat protein/serine/threonine protein kinase